ncbi:MAG: 16S rRNA (uracil(1498)-N(3))-methyltransferase [Prolixibacteraceae bacterium]|nr:16S rRNA (uracil(1498)-N(3))-methyltransferase [Prolixibacteraceae bacterium]
MQLFYLPEITGNNIILNSTESKHVIKVLRLVKGDIIGLTDGKGGLYKAEITIADSAKCGLNIIEIQKEFEKRNFYLHMAVAPTKNIDRFEWFLEKSTEIGIDEITPLLTEHSERKIIKPERLEKVIIAAMKQSLKAYKPKLNELTPFRKIIAANSFEEKYIAHCYDGEKQGLKTIAGKGKNILILIGPEGDFSTDEIKVARETGFTEISLGNSRLRTETAGVVACHIINLVNE